MMIYYLRTEKPVLRFIHLKIVILEIFLLLHSLYLLLRFDFIDWEKLQTCNIIFIQLLETQKRGADRLMNHTSCESFALALMIKYLQYNTIWSSSAAASSKECIIHAPKLHHGQIHDYDCTRSITHRYFSFFFLVCNCTQYV